MVGNETLLRNDMSADELISIIQRVKRASPVPVTTGETWDIWLGQDSDPSKVEKKVQDAIKLASAVDFIAAHILPYWDKQPLQPGGRPHHQHLRPDPRRAPRQADRDRRVRLAERRLQLQAAVPGRIEQALVIREFLSRAEAYGIDYNIIEAVDQPWKTYEGGVGAYWGLFDAAAIAKFSWTGPVSDPDHWKVAGLALAARACCSR